jgi:hypothetical protein
MKALWISVGTAILLAQPAVQAKQLNQQQSGAAQNMQQTQSKAQNLNPAEQLREDLERSGFRKVEVVPQSFLIRATDPHGNPVMMVLTPNMVAGVVEENAGQAVGRSAVEAPKFAQGPVRDVTETKLDGTKVMSSDNQMVGTITGIGISNDGKLSYLLSLPNGGDVAVGPGAMTLSYNEANESWNAQVNATADQVMSAPQIEPSGQ